MGGVVNGADHAVPSDVWVLLPGAALACMQVLSKDPAGKAAIGEAGARVCSAVCAECHGTLTD